MGFRKPISTFGGLRYWENIQQDELFIMQKHKTGFWPYKYRILMRENRMEIANSNDKLEIDYDWRYLENHVVPQLDSKIDWLNNKDLHKLIWELVKFGVTRKPKGI